MHFQLSLRWGSLLKTLLATCNHQPGQQSPGRWRDYSGQDHCSEGISQYINAKVMVFMPEGTMVATGGRFLKIVGFFLLILPKKKIYITFT